jgi:AbrB family looped-hinge helix DNA binding protein
MEATLSSKNQITIPKEAREFLHARAGDKLKFFMQPDGRLVILPTIPVSKLKGSLPKLKRPVSVEDMNKAIHTYHARR